MVGEGGKGGEMMGNCVQLLEMVRNWRKSSQSLTHNTHNTQKQDTYNTKNTQKQHKHTTK
jgi:hypothetical protein